MKFRKFSHQTAGIEEIYRAIIKARLSGTWRGGMVFAKGNVFKMALRGAQPVTCLQVGQGHRQI